MEFYFDLHDTIHIIYPLACCKFDKQFISKFLLCQEADVSFNRLITCRYRSMAQRSKCVRNRTRPMMRNLMRPLRCEKLFFCGNLFSISPSHSQGGVGAEVESWPPRKTHSRYFYWCFSWNPAELLNSLSHNLTFGTFEFTTWTKLMESLISKCLSLLLAHWSL